MSELLKPLAGEKKAIMGINARNKPRQKIHALLLTDASGSPQRKP